MYWHNITEGIYNETDIGDFIEILNKGDIIKYTKRGNAIIFDFSELDCEYTKEQFLELYKEYYGEDYESIRI